MATHSNNFFFWIIKKTLFFTFAVILLVCLYVGFQFHQFQNSPINLSKDSATFSITKGETIRQVAQKLADKELINDSLMFIVLAKINGHETSIKAGEYSLQTGNTPNDLLRLFIKGSSILYSFTIIEGWTFNQLLAAINKNPILEQTISSKEYTDVMAHISNASEHPEGLFLPDTYHFPRGTSDIDFLKRAYKTMQSVLQTEWDNRAENLPYESPYDALILASIIEKETGVTYEMPLISAAFVQRLKKGMKLQTDPTIIYGMGDRFDGNIRYKDLREDTPYNTYVHRGLTPTPIALPGREAIHAALNPADSDVLYFVAKGDGTHYFSRTLDEHNAAVSKYQLKGRKPKRKAESG